MPTQRSLATSRAWKTVRIWTILIASMGICHVAARVGVQSQVEGVAILALPFQQGFTPLDLIGPLIGLGSGAVMLLASMDIHHRSGRWLFIAFVQLVAAAAAFWGMASFVSYVSAV